MSSDGEHVGDVERIVIEPESGKATHFVISQGMLFKDRTLVPAHWVKSVEEDKLYLTVPARLLERLPAYQENT
jgi:sporulation protein YlmC with PRC-barrel domain